MLAILLRMQERVSANTSMFSLTGKTALVTGAMRGMGKADAQALARQGATVVVTDIDLDACKVVRDEIIAQGGQALAYAMDVTDQTVIDFVLRDVVEQKGTIDILVNNAGVYAPTPALELTEEEWDRTIDINLKGQFLCAVQVARIMREHGGGRIINIASVASGQVGVGLAGGAHYAATKGGIIALTESLATEWAPYRILVNAIAPGAIDTDMSRSRRMTSEQMEGFLSQTVPLRRIGQPEEVAAMVVFLASDEASYITGSTFYVDGGWLAS